jgi:hypothetical protein
MPASIQHPAGQIPHIPFFHCSSGIVILIFKIDPHYSIYKNIRKPTCDVLKSDPLLWTAIGLISSARQQLRAIQKILYYFS